MSKVVEAVSATLGQGRLSDDPDHEAACDHVGAMAAVDPLASALLRYRNVGDKTMRQSVLRQLRERIWKRGEAKVLITKLAEHALDEHMKPTCLRCNGKGAVESLINSKRNVVCRRCNGSGLSAHNIQARMRAMGCGIVKYEQKWSYLFNRAHMVLSNADGNMMRVLAKQLERNKRLE